MNVNQPSQAVNSNSVASPGTTPGNELTGDSFMTLLVAQLKAQDPTNPMDPTQFVAQLVQFNTLQQIIQMNQTLQNIATSVATQPPASTPATK
jgi:flagellar basal-body rod modification protein FlgD